MTSQNNRRMKTETMVLGAIMTALVIVLQLLATFTAFFGPFSTAVALIPIILGAVMCGAGVGAWLGFVFGVVVLASGGAALFWAFDIPGTVITVLLKGSCCGLAAGLVYRLFFKLNRYAAVVAAAVTAPVVNTGIFLLGSAVFFLDDVTEIAAAAGSAETGMAVFFGFAFANFLIELLTNVLLSPVVIRLLDIRRKKA
ncbi:MAG: ECF transporter S component [Ruminococcaceae bacterium]|nr:ECF transporter S component [Oscillospiraceae bacterium]